MTEEEAAVPEPQTVVPQEDEVFEHYKGNFYRVRAVGSHSETLEKLVVYQQIGAEVVWIRPLSMWFEEVSGRPRFRRVGRVLRNGELRFDKPLAAAEGI